MEQILPGMSGHIESSLTVGELIGDVYIDNQKMEKTCMKGDAVVYTMRLCFEHCVDM